MIKGHVRSRTTLQLLTKPCSDEVLDLFSVFSSLSCSCVSPFGWLFTLASYGLFSLDISAHIAVLKSKSCKLIFLTRFWCLVRKLPTLGPLTANLFWNDCDRGLWLRIRFSFIQSLPLVSTTLMDRDLFGYSGGKDDQSTSEPAFMSCAIKMWGCATVDVVMEVRDILPSSTNANQLGTLINNKVSGRLFEIKVNHTTFFGAYTEYLKAIQMLLFKSSSAYTRSKPFCEAGLGSNLE